MLLPPDEIERAFAKIVLVRAYLAENFPKTHSAALDYAMLAQAISNLARLEVQIYAVLAPGDLVAGKVERYQSGKVVILVKQGLSNDLIRFVIVKELCHLVIDDEPDWSNDAVKVIKEMKAEFDLASINGNGVPNPSRTQMSEHLAVVSAVALMYPCEQHEPDMLKVFKRQTTMARIALDYQLPPWAVELAFTKGEIFSLYPL